MKTDLALERNRPPKEDGYCYQETALGLCKLHTLTIRTQAAARAMKCEKGIYDTLLFPPITSLHDFEREELKEQFSDLLTERATLLLGTKDMRNQRILIVGFGNRAYTADALGPLTAERVNATAHLKRETPTLLEKLACAEIAVFTPGVTATSGMESTELVLATTRHFSPTLVLTVDALAARSYSRLATTIQLTDTGISPGSGVGCSRKGLNSALLKCPMLAIGVPTVTDTTTLICDTLAQVGKRPPRALRKKLGLTGDCYVCPKDADSIIDQFSEIIATAINRVFGIPDLSFLS